MNTAGLEARIESYLAQLEERLQSELPGIVKVCTTDIASRAPTQDEEKNYVVTPSGGRELGTRSTPKGDRQSFIRSPGIWINEAVQDPRTFSITGLTVLLGFVSELNKLTAWSWKNKDGTERTSLQAHGAGTFLWFEYGRDKVEIGPIAGHYPLQTDFSDTVYSTVNKSYPAKRMYTSFDTMIFNAAVIGVASTVEF